MFLEIESHETGFEVLAEEGTPLLDGPFDARFCHGDLDVEGIGNRRKKVNELADYRRSVSFLSAPGGMMFQKNRSFLYQSLRSLP